MTQDRTVVEPSRDPTSPRESVGSREGSTRHTGVQTVSVLGATGSVGDNTLDLIGRNPERFRAVALTANTSAEKLAECAIRLKAEFAVVAEPGAYGQLKERLSGSGIRAGAGQAALLEAASLDADCVVAAISGAAGLAPTLAAVRRGKRVALANKECLVAAGALFMREVAASGCTLLPVDSEHSAVFQCLEGIDRADVSRIVLTASGGPFREWPLERIRAATPAMALKHPNWSMGRKISIDSATLMNKGLELIEAQHLFAVTPGQLDVLVHPQSIMHCLVECRDGSTLTHMSNPDMRVPIAHALSWPGRIETPVPRLDLAKLAETRHSKNPTPLASLPCPWPRRRCVAAVAQPPFSTPPTRLLWLPTSMRGLASLTSRGSYRIRSMGSSGARFQRHPIASKRPSCSMPRAGGKPEP